MASLRTEAWLLRGISSIPGELKLAGSALTFEARGTGSAWPWQLRKLEAQFASPSFASRLEKGERCQLFSFSTHDLKAWVPWYYFGGGIKISQGAHLARISFGRPGNTQVNWVGSVQENLSEIGVMRKRGELWQAALAQAAQQGT